MSRFVSEIARCTWRDRNAIFRTGAKPHPKRSLRVCQSLSHHFGRNNIGISRPRPRYPSTASVTSTLRASHRLKEPGYASLLPIWALARCGNTHIGLPIKPAPKICKPDKPQNGEPQAAREEVSPGLVTPHFPSFPQTLGSTFRMPPAFDWFLREHESFCIPLSRLNNDLARAAQAVTMVLCLSFKSGFSNDINIIQLADSHQVLLSEDRCVEYGVEESSRLRPKGMMIKTVCRE